ncbi:hypothetical protein A7E75_06670 [Syntrophotalea acetylenica]|jgi:hypothetical protein|uniref:Uncharacterized protein n=2 Tax=Syntrophotaleaceae TaxID=2812024 RepID=A0A1L3GFP5_SYNAC|nr:hypothetical protein A7E75_06670 [Syntrophotalea acetylenica]APG42802.1 hypothetical protein A6070_00605 [Syntrophotalea acetylenica]
MSLSAFWLFAIIGQVSMARKGKTRSKSKKSYSFSGVLCWVLCFLALLLVVDQLALRLRLSSPLLRELQDGYREFRSRLSGARPQRPLTIESIIEEADSQGGGASAEEPAGKSSTNTSQTPPLHPRSTPGAADYQVKTRRYLYVDADGELHFADRMEDIPVSLRDGAQPLRD